MSLDEATKEPEFKFDTKKLEQELGVLNEESKVLNKIIKEIQRWQGLLSGQKKQTAKPEEVTQAVGQAGAAAAAIATTAAAAASGARGVSGADLVKLENDILTGKKRKGTAPSWLSKAMAVSYNPWNMDKEMAARSKSVSQAFFKHGFTGAFLQSIRLGRIKAGTGLWAPVKHALGEKFDAYIAKNKQKKLINIYDNIRTEKKKKKGTSTFGAALKIMLRYIQKVIVDRVTTVVNVTTQAVMTRFAATTAGRKILNATTAIKTFAGEKLGPVKTVITTTGKVVTGVFDAISLAGSVASGLVSGAVPALLVVAATGGSIPAGIATLALVGGTAAVNNILEAKHLSSIPFIRSFQDNLGSGKFYNYDGSLKIGEFPQETQLKNIFSPFSRVSRAFNAGATAGAWGSVAGMFLGPLVGLDPGTGSLIGGAVGTAIGAGSRAIWDGIYGKAAAEAATKGAETLLGKLGYVPFMEILGQVQGNLWIASQMDLIIHKYHGDIGRYFSENFINGDPRKIQLENILLIAGNWLNLGFAVPTALFPMVTIGAIAKMLGAFGLKQIIPVGPATIGSIVGEVAGVATLVLLGVPLGPAAIVGITIGSIVGTTLGIIVSAVSGFFDAGGSWLAGVGITALFSWLGTTAGGWIGSIFDSTLGKFAGLVNITINGIAAIANLLSMIQAKMDIGGMIGLVISLIALFNAMDKLGVMNAANQCLETKNCPDPNASPGYGQANPSLQDLSFYGVTIIQSSAQSISDDQRTALMSYLDTSADNIHSRYGSKKVFINTVNGSGFEGDNFVIIGLTTDDFASQQTLASAFDKQLLNVSDSSSQVLSSPENLMQALN
jgi:hypothetical protein